MSKSNVTAAIAAASCFFIASNQPVFAQDSEQKKEPAPYSQPLGEQPTYGKKYHPTEISSNRFFDVNPLLLIRRGIGLEFENRLGDQSTWGADFQLLTGSTEQGAYTGSYTFVGLAPKFRFYPMDSLSGPFVGAKLILGQSSGKISGNGKSTEKNTFQAIPAAHVGYRFVKIEGLTVTGYLGGGFALNKFEVADDSTQSEDWRGARKDVNKWGASFRPDMGLTIGVAFY